MIFKAASKTVDKPGKASLPLATLKLGRKWKLEWMTSKSGDAIIARYRPKKSDAYLDLGAADILITSQPFEGRLTEAPSVMDNSAAIQYGIKSWLPQKWTNQSIPSLERKIRCYEDEQSGGADNAMHSTEPFAVVAGNGQTIWMVIQVQLGSKKKVGLDLKKVLAALKIP